jgi:hypothetical protein
MAGAAGVYEATKGLHALVRKAGRTAVRLEEGAIRGDPLRLGQGLLREGSSESDEDEDANNSLKRWIDSNKE